MTNNVWSGSRVRCGPCWATCLAREEIEDPRVRGVGLITVTHVRVSGDLQHARALFTVHGLDNAALERVRAGLDHASGYFRRAIAKRLRTKVSPDIRFEIDHVFEQETKIETLLHEIRTDAGAAAAKAGRRAWRAKAGTKGRGRGRGRGKSGA